MECFYVRAIRSTHLRPTIRQEFEDLVRRDLLGPAGGDQEIITAREDIRLVGEKPASGARGFCVFPLLNAAEATLKLVAELPRLLVNC